MKKRQQKVRLIRAAIQLIFFIAAPSLFSTAFAGIKSVFLAIGGQQSGNLELLSEYYSPAFNPYHSVWTSFLRLCLCIWNFGRCPV